MNTYLLTLKLPQIHAGTAEAVVYSSPLDSALYSIEIRDYSDLEQVARQITGITLIDETLLEKDKSTADICVYTSAESDRDIIEAFITRRLTEMNIPFTAAKEIIKPEDWENNWKEYYHPMEIGEKLLICPSWEQCPQTGRTVLTLDPGLAFGTGRHETTRLCLESLEQLDLAGKSVLDIGTGSGILAIAAAKLGASRSRGIDIDPTAIKTAEQNAKENNVNIDFSVCNLLTENLPFDEKFDVITMNIVADIIIQMLPRIIPLAAPTSLAQGSGTLILSGIIAGRLSGIETALTQHGLPAERITADKDWRCIVATNYS